MDPSPRAEDSMSDQEQVYPQQTNTEQQQDDPQEETAIKLLQYEEQQEKKSNKSGVLSQDVQMKLEQLLEDIKQNDGKNFQSIITLRMKQLAYNKILVLTYERSYFRLVHAHFHIGKQYLKFKCYDQAINHLDQAITKNVRAGTSLLNKLYHSYLLTYFGICCFHSQKYDRALTELSKAINLQDQYEDSQRKTIQNFQTLMYYAKVKAELKHADALEYMKSVSERAQKFYESKGGHTYGLILYEYGKLQLKLGNNKATIELYEKAIDVIRMGNNPDHEIEIIKLYQELADIYEPINTQHYLAILKLKYQVFEDTYGNSDKKSIKQQRNLAAALLKNKKIDQSLQQFDDILEKQQKVYGQNSLQVGKQYKTIANIYIAKHDYKQAESNFKKAMKIFHDLGDQRLVRQVRMKLSSLQMHQQ